MSLFFKNRHPRSDLSAYIDEQLKPKRAAMIEAHLASCLECGARLAELRELRSALGSMPEMSVPRSFALPQSQAAQKAPTTGAGYRPAPLVTGLRLGSAGLAMALAVVLVIDAGGGSGDPGQNDAASEMQALATESRSSEDDSLAGEGSEVASSPPPVVPAGGGDIAGGTTRDPDATAEATPTPGGAAPGETSTPATPEAITAYDADDGSKGADAQNGPADTIDSAASSDGDNDLLVIEIILGVTAVLVLLASVFVARSRRQSI